MERPRTWTGDSLASAVVTTNLKEQSSKRLRDSHSKKRMRLSRVRGGSMVRGLCFGSDLCHM